MNRKPIKWIKSINLQKENNEGCFTHKNIRMNRKQIKRPKCIVL